MTNERALGKAIEHYCSDFSRGTHRSPQTEKAYRCDLKQFQQVVGIKTPVRAIDEQCIELWLSHLRQKVLKTASIRRKIACVRTFLRRQRELGILDSDPFERVRIELRRERRLTRVLSASDFARLLSIADCRVEDSGHEAGLGVLLARRDRAMIWLLCGTGLRVGELVALTLRQIDADEGLIRVNGKGERERLAFMVDEDRRRLHDYLTKRAEFHFDHDRVFVNHRGLPISTEGVRNVVARLGESGGASRRITPHMLRHTAATRLLENGANLRIVQEYLGHASIKTTERYTHVTAGALRNAVHDHSPLKRASEAFGGRA